MIARVAKKDTFRGERRKFAMGGMEGLSIANTVEHTKMIIGGLDIEENFKGGFIVKNTTWGVVDKIGNSEGIFTTKFQR